MAKRKSYDDKFRASAVVMLEAAGYPDKRGALEYTAKHLGVPARTLSRWFNGENNAPPDELVSKNRADLKTLIENEIYGILETMPKLRGDAEYRELGTVFGIMLDKLQLLKGEPTDRHEIIDKLSDAERSARIAALLDRAGARRDGRADSEFVQ